MLLYADEDFAFPAVEELRVRGHDVLTAQEDGGTDHRNGVSFDQEEGSAVGGRTGCDEFGAYASVARHALNCAEWRRTQDGACRNGARTGRPGVPAS
jgi:hypothetical protein